MAHTLDSFHSVAGLHPSNTYLTYLTLKDLPRRVCKEGVYNMVYKLFIICSPLIMLHTFTKVTPTSPIYQVRLLTLLTYPPRRVGIIWYKNGSQFESFSF